MTLCTIVKERQEEEYVIFFFLSFYYMSPLRAVRIGLQTVQLALPLWKANRHQALMIRALHKAHITSCHAGDCHAGICSTLAELSTRSET